MKRCAHVPTVARTTVRTMTCLTLLPVLAAACGGSSGKKDPPGPQPIGQRPVEPGSMVTPGMPATQQAELDRVKASLATVEKLDAPGLVQRYPTTFTDKLSYDPASAQFLDLIEASPLRMNIDEKAVLAKNGFVISDRQRFPAFPYGYQAIYSADLPVFISADSIMHAVHRSYDDILKQIELTSLRAELEALLSTMRASLAAGAIAPLGEQAARDADLYLTVALGLLRAETVAPVKGASSAEIGKLLAGASAANGAAEIELFGAKRIVDFSQFKPRGHYTDHPDLEKYFRAMIWLGRVDFRLIETEADHSQRFHRRQFNGMLALHTLVQGTALARWQRLDRTIEMFVGESDNMRVPEVSKLLADLKVDGLAATAALSDQELAAALVAGNYGGQRISSHYMVNGLGKGTLPLSRTFLLLGQRYVLDSHVFSNVVYDRVQGGSVRRMMPDPLDAAFAALGNNQAGNLLEPDLRKYGYASDLAAMRVLADDHGEGFWGANLYNTWLAALRTLSPQATAPGGPLEVASTEAWGRRLLNTQLASWAELRHDTVLYVKQSYTAGAVCEFPDALVEPNPAFFAKLAIYAQQGLDVVKALTGETTGMVAYFTRLGEVAALLREMAEHQRDGKPFTQTHMAFINETVRIQNVCGGGFVEGWYASLFFDRGEALKFEPTIADVHTQPTDEGGGEVGRVLHVGTGYARMMVVTAKTCAGPRAYVGLASSYFEVITKDWKRMDDPEWEKQLMPGATPPSEVRWMADLIAK